MNTKELKVETGLKRLLQIEFEKPDYNHELAAMLAGEYIRRVAVMAEQINIPISSPFFDPLSILSIEGRAASLAMQEFQSRVGYRLKNGYLRRTCECYLQWCEGVDAGDVVAVKYPEVFEPLIKLLELGGSFGCHHGELLTGTSAIPLRDWKRFVGAAPFQLPVCGRTSE